MRSNAYTSRTTIVPTAVLIAGLMAGLGPGAVEAARIAAPVPVAPEGTTGTPLYFIDFDIGTTVVRGGAAHQDNNPDSAPYVELPNAGSPLTMVSFTMPPNFDLGGDVVARVLYTTTVAPCFFVLQVDLVGYGPSHSAALFDAFWPGSGTPSDEGIVQVPTAFNTHEVLITFQGSSGFPAHPGDAMKLLLRRDSADVNDTCTVDALLRSISLTYDGVLVFADGFGTGDTTAWSAP